MNRQVKKGILTALSNGSISKVEAMELLRSDGKIILDLSSKAISPNPMESIIEKIPELKNHFIRIISLGHGINRSE